MRIYDRDSIVSHKSFDERKPSGLYVWACAGTYLLSITYQQVQVVYHTFPETQELSRLILADWDHREMTRLAGLNREAEVVVEDFYGRFSELKTPGRILLDAEIASYLLIAESTLRNVRAKLIRESSC